MIACIVGKDGKTILTLEDDKTYSGDPKIVRIAEIITEGVEKDPYAPLAGAHMPPDLLGIHTVRDRIYPGHYIDVDEKYVAKPDSIY